ncbi:hypothetical protein [Pararhodobacter oceanensis]|uniref:hypothetical protein n=1 Tax=Pararhodobacter oceanensis TaxID=2172121 RepID=UPI003A92CB0E
MGLTLKHVVQTKSGRWQYRRRVPKDVSEAIHKREFKGVLGDSEREALKAYASFHASVEREIEKAKSSTKFGIAAQRGELTGYEVYELARTRAAELAPSGTDWGTREAVVASIAGQYIVDPATGNPDNATELDRQTINIVRNGPEIIRRPMPTLEDAKKLYLAERRAAESVDGYIRFERQVDQIVLLATNALGRDPILQDLTREDARAVRDFMLDQFKKDGSRISPSSVARYLNGLKAVINFAKIELDLPATFKSPFNNLSMPQGLGAKGHTADDKKREPLPADVLSATRQRILTHALPELKHPAFNLRHIRQP